MPVEGSYWILAITCMLQTLSPPNPKVLWTKKFIPVSDNRTRQYYKFTTWRLFLRCHRYGYNTSWRSCRCYCSNLCSNSRIETWNREFWKLLHLSCVSFYIISRSPPPSPILACLCPKPLPPLNYLACDTVATVQLSFGSKYWTIDPVDFRLTRLNGSDCLGAFFVLPSGSSAPSWIIGDTFLVRFKKFLSPTPPSPLSSRKLIEVFYLFFFLFFFWL